LETIQNKSKMRKGGKKSDVRECTYRRHSMLQKKVPDTVTRSSADTWIATLEELIIVKDEILEDYRLHGMKNEYGIY